MKEIFQILICICEISIPLWFIEKWVQKRKQNWWEMGLWYICIGIWIGLTYYQRLFLFYSRLYMILEILVSMVLVLWRCQIKLKTAFLITSIFYESIYMLDLLMLMLAGYWQGKVNMLQIQSGITVQGNLMLSISRIFALVVVCFLHKNRKGIIAVYESDWKMLYYIPAIQYLSLIACDTYFHNKEDIVALRSIFISFMVTICLVAILTIFFIKKKGEYDRGILEERANVAEQKYKERLEDDKERDIMVHDIQNHLVVLKGILREKDISRALSYIEAAQNNYIVVKQRPQTGNIVIDAILNDKIAKAEAAGIQIKILSDDLSESFITDKDWCSILSNLLDNAIEACIRVKEEKWIKVKFENRAVGMVLNMENSCICEKGGKEERFTAGKKGGRHGIGLQSVQYALKKYNVNYSYKISDSVFSTNIIFFNQNTLNNKKYDFIKFT